MRGGTARGGATEAARHAAGSGERGGGGAGAAGGGWWPVPEDMPLGPAARRRLTSRSSGRDRVGGGEKGRAVNHLYYGDNLDWLRDKAHFPDEFVDPIYLDPPFNSNASYNVLFRGPKGNESPAQIEASSQL